MLSPTADLPLVIGVNEVAVRAVDQAGNQSTTSLNITREAPNAPPTVDAGTRPQRTLARIK